jgi:hypothetical protein
MRRSVLQDIWKNLQFWEFFFVRVLALRPALGRTGAVRKARRDRHHRFFAGTDNLEEAVFQLVRRDVDVLAVCCCWSDVRVCAILCMSTWCVCVVVAS